MTATAEGLRPHPAKFSPAILAKLDELMGPGLWLDPFAGTGLVHTLARPGAPGRQTVGVELEPEWAAYHADTLVGDALHLPAVWTGRFDGVVTSPCYGNRMADHHEARERCKVCAGSGKLPTAGTLPENTCHRCDGAGSNAYKRLTYRHQLGRPPSPGSAAVLPWGPAYRRFHTEAWTEARRVLRPGGHFLLNVKDHYERRQRQRVTAWHTEALERLGFHLVAGHKIPAPGMRFGAGREARHEHEWVLDFVAPA